MGTNSLSGEAMFPRGMNFYSKQISHQKNSSVITSSSVNIPSLPRRGVFSLGFRKSEMEYSACATWKQSRHMIGCPRSALYIRQTMLHLSSHSFLI